MAIATQTQRNTLANAYAAAATYAALFVSPYAGGTSAGTEPSGGSPAYARKALTAGGGATGAEIWTTATTSSTQAIVTFNVPVNAIITGAGVYNASTAGTFLDGTTVTSQTFASQGTYTLTLTYTQS